MPWTGWLTRPVRTGGGSWRHSRMRTPGPLTHRSCSARTSSPPCRPDGAPTPLTSSLVSDTVFRELLTQPRRLPKTGVDRFLRLGRIERYPANAAERHGLLAWIAGQAFRPGEDLTEKQVNERLLSYTDDVVLLRRYLVDAGLLQRTASGSSYSRPADSPGNPE